MVQRDSGLEPVDEAPYASTSGFDAMAAGVPWLQTNRQQQQQHLGFLPRYIDFTCLWHWHLISAEEYFQRLQYDRPSVLSSSG